MAKPLTTNAQNLVYHLEVGVGPVILKTTLYLIFMALMALLYVATQYQGFFRPRAMDQAQVARTYAETGHFHTRVIRPGDLRLLEERGRLTRRTDAPQFAGHPDMVNAPAYPLLLGTVFRVFNTRFPAASTAKWTPEQWVIIPLSLLFSFGAGLFMYLTGRSLFSPRVAFTAVTVFFLSAQTWQVAVEGTELAFALLCGSFACWCLSKLLSSDAEGTLSGARLWVPLVLSSFALLLLFLTRYASVVLVPAFVLALFLGLGKRAWLPSLVLLAVLGLGIAPWVARNLSVSGSPFGFAPYYAMNDSEAHNYFMRSYFEMDLQDVSLVRGVAARTLSMLKRTLTFNEVMLGSGLALALFISTFFYKFQRKPVRCLRWMILLAYGLLVIAAGIFGETQLDTAHLLFPLVLLYGTAFFYLLLDRLQISVQVVQLGIVSLFVLLQSVPLLVNLMPPRPSAYPPYRAPDIHLITQAFETNELLCTDMPWATAWYGGQLSLYLPINVDQFFEIHDRLQPVRGLYMTMITRNRPYHSELVRGNYQSWRPIMDLQLPRGFPLRAGFPIRGGESLILADRNRWAGDS